MKPNFLGIGSVRGGSTWLHNLLTAHPDFYLPTKRKEIQYFTKYWERGADWYEECFKGADEAKWIGEITPGYLIAPEGPNRICEHGGIEKFVVILRNPVDRMVSHYRWHLRVTGDTIPFRDFRDRLSKISVENGLYAKHLNRYFKNSQENGFLFSSLRNRLPIRTLR